MCPTCLRGAGVMLSLGSVTLFLTDFQMLQKFLAEGMMKTVTADPLRNTQFMRVTTSSQQAEQQTYISAIYPSENKPNIKTIFDVSLLKM